MVYAVSAGPLHDPVAQKLTQTCLSRAAVPPAREKPCKCWKKLSVHREIEITADPALLLQPEPLPPDALSVKASMAGAQ